MENAEVRLRELELEHAERVHHLIHSSEFLSEIAKQEAEEEKLLFDAMNTYLTKEIMHSIEIAASIHNVTIPVTIE